MASTQFSETPGFFGIIFGVALSLLAGALLAAAHLVAKPVEVLTVEPKQPEAGVVYFVRGVKGGDWERKVAAMNNSGVTVRFSEGELNSWAERVFAQQLISAKGGATPEREAEAKAMASNLNLRLVGEDLQIGLVMDRAFGAADAKLVVQTRGSFVRGVQGWGFRPESGYVGALPLHKIPGALALTRTYFAKFTPDLSKAESIVVGDGVFAVRMQ
jgi:hypothetical protein